VISSCDFSESHPSQCIFRTNLLKLVLPFRKCCIRVQYECIYSLIFIEDLSIRKCLVIDSEVLTNYVILLFKVQLSSFTIKSLSVCGDLFPISSVRSPNIFFLFIHCSNLLPWCNISRCCVVVLASLLVSVDFQDFSAQACDPCDVIPSKILGSLNLGE
jgi:hypothetical protein